MTWRSRRSRLVSRLLRNGGVMIDETSRNPHFLLCFFHLFYRDLVGRTSEAAAKRGRRDTECCRSPGVVVVSERNHRHCCRSRGLRLSHACNIIYNGNAYIPIDCRRAKWVLKSEFHLSQSLYYIEIFFSSKSQQLARFIYDSISFDFWRIATVFTMNIRI